MLVLPSFFYKEYQIIKSKKDTSLQRVSDFSENDLNTKKRGFSFFIITYNNIKTIENCLNSILSQNCKEFNVIFFDLGSIDGTFEFLIGEGKKHKNLKVQKCNGKNDLLLNYYNKVQMCSDDRIIIHMYGSDSLKSENTIEVLNHHYLHPEIWMAYGQDVDLNRSKKRVNKHKNKRTLGNKKVSGTTWVHSSFKTYYAKLLKQQVFSNESLATFKDEIDLLSTLAEAYKAYIRYIPSLQFIRRDKETKKGRQDDIDIITQRLTWPINYSLNILGADWVVFSDNSPKVLDRCLCEGAKYFKGVLSTKVFYQYTNANFLEYESLKNKYPNVIFIQHTEQAFSSFSKIVFDEVCGEEGDSPYLLISKDDEVLNADVNILDCIAALRKTNASKCNIEIGLKESFSNFAVESSINKQLEFNDLRFALYRRLDVEQALRGSFFDNVKQLCTALNHFFQTKSLQNASPSGIFFGDSEQN